MTEQLLREFFDEMHCRSNTRYRQLTENEIICCTMSIFHCHGRVVVWRANEELSERTGVRWEKAVAVGGPFRDCRELFETVESVEGIRRQVEDTTSENIEPIEA